MRTMNLQIDESFFPHFKALIDSFINDNKVKIIYNTFPKELMIDNSEEVRSRVLLAEERIKDGNYLTENEFWDTIEKNTINK